jgi:hypothetical protein
MERIGMKKMLLILYAIWFVIGLVTVRWAITQSERTEYDRRVEESRTFCYLSQEA